ncbi:MAG: hypothetical protein JNJ57_14755 [Saprospiraceae bacterium]|nr:hypothetical protein [Saprospiraceae bacterium]
MATTMASEAKTTSKSSELQVEKSTSQPLSPRARIARLILIYHFALIVLSGVYYLLRGFDLEEFTSLMGILAPITALYGGAVFRYLGRSITEPNPGAQNMAPINGMVKWLVNGHFIAVFALISLKAFAPNMLNFQDMTMFLTLVESALGVYMGNIILALFEGKVANGEK